MERIHELVVDASVALKWFVEEDDSKKALDVLDYITEKAIPIVPTLFFYEISNVCTRSNYVTGRGRAFGTGIGIRFSIPNGRSLHSRYLSRS